MKINDLVLAQMIRRECTDCGSERLWWTTGADFAGKVEGRELLAQLAANNGVPMRDLLGARLWSCGHCGELGVIL